MDVRRLPSLLLALAALCAGGCTATEDDAAPVAAESSPASIAVGEPTPSPSTTVSATPSATPTPTPTARPNPVSLQALMAKQYDGRGLRVGRVLARTASYTRHFVTYKSGKLTISGILNVPDGKGPFPALVLAHGYIDPAIYTNGRGMMREQDYLARRGYVVLHVDYRNHAQSDDDPRRRPAAASRLHRGRHQRGARDQEVAAALPRRRAGRAGGPLARRRRPLQRAGRPARAGGRGGRVRAGELDAADNFDRWIRGDGERRALAQRIIGSTASPEQNPEFWSNASPADRSSTGSPSRCSSTTGRPTTPARPWSRQTLAALEAAGADARLVWYDGEQHAFGPQWPLSMRRTVAFFDRNLT